MILHIVRHMDRLDVVECQSAVITPAAAKTGGMKIRVAHMLVADPNREERDEAYACLRTGAGYDQRQRERSRCLCRESRPRTIRQGDCSGRLRCRQQQHGSVAVVPYSFHVKNACPLVYPEDAFNTEMHPPDA